MLRSDFEEILILDTPYYKNLKDTYRDTHNFNRCVDILRKLSKDNGFIQAFENKGGKELVYLGRKIFSLQEEFVSNYIRFLSDESSVNKWEKFFERYNKNVFGIYEKFVTDDSNKILIFEIVNRKLLRDFLTKYTMDISFEKKGVISERFGIVVNQLFNYLRNSLAKNIAIMDSPLIDSYQKVPLLPHCSHGEMMKLLRSRFLQAGLPEPLFTCISKNIVTSYYTDTKDEIIGLLRRKTYLSKEDIFDVFKSHFFFPDDDTLREILEIVRGKAKHAGKIITKKKEMVSQNIIDIKQKSEETANAIKDKLITLVRNNSSEESIDTLIKRLHRHLIADTHDLRCLRNEYQEYLRKEKELNSLLNFKARDLLKFVIKNEWDSYITLFFNKKKTFADEELQLLIKDAMNEIRNDKSAMELMNEYRVSGFLKEKYNADVINEKFHIITEDVILPLVQSFLLEELVDYYPKISGSVPSEGIRYLAEEALSGKVSVIEKDVKVVPRDTSFSGLHIQHYRDLVSTLIYDVRGSTFMGTKLRDAKRESEIRNFFQESMLSIVEKHGGIPIKDTGDGGVAIFTANCRDIKKGETLELAPGSALPAVRCGLEMTKGAKKFVQDNITKYHDWFREAEKRRIDFEGATYATLPPQYRSIFQIGVGIASGISPKEIYLEKNAYGELDLTGMLVREANFYSKVKGKEKSTVICDDATVYNLLLNINKFTFLSETGLRTDPLLLDVEQGLEYWINQKISKRGFILDLYKIFVTQLGQEITRPGSLKILLGIFDIAIDETGEIKDEKGGRGKFLFEVSSEAVK
jgi:hypothetical protein